MLLIYIYLLQKIKHSRTNEEDVETKLKFDKVSYIQFHKFWLHLERILHTNFLKKSENLKFCPNGNLCHPKYFPFNQKN